MVLPLYCALGCDIRNARRDLIPERQALSVAREEGQRRLPYRWENRHVLGNGIGQRARKYM
jgi:hypothetical protein